jgi:hypothetical protein
MGLYSPLIEQSHSTTPRRRRTRGAHQRKQHFFDTAGWLWFAAVLSLLTLAIMLVWLAPQAA